MASWTKGHPDGIALQAFDEQRLTPGGLTRIGAHVDRCSHCQDVLHAYAELSTLLSQVAPAKIPVGLDEKIVANLLSETVLVDVHHPLASRPLMTLIGSLAALAGAALLILVPQLSSADHLGIVLGYGLKQVLLLGQNGFTIITSLTRVLEPLRFPAQLVLATSLALSAWLIDHRFPPRYV